MNQYIQNDRRGRITIFTICRQEAMNALNVAAHFELSALLDGFAADPDQWVAIITGAGERAFCAGNDLKQIIPDGEAIVPPTGFGGLTGRFDLKKPVIAAVNGIAFGGGFELALACDIVVASEKALFALPEAKVGLAALAGGLLRLPYHVGPKRAMEIILTGRRIGAAEALILGLVNEVVPESALLAQAFSWAARICEAAPLSIRASKATMKRGLEAGLERAIAEHLDYPEVRAMLLSNDALEGPRAFTEKRPPAWSGR